MLRFVAGLRAGSGCLAYACFLDRSCPGRVSRGQSSACGRDRSRQVPSAEGAAPGAARGVPGRRLLADRRVRCVLLALVASGSADGFLPVVLRFAVLRVTGSAGKLGFVLACQSAVALLVTLAGGLAGDRFPRGRILIASLLARMTAAAALAAALLTGTASFGLLL